MNPLAILAWLLICAAVALYLPLLYLQLLNTWFRLNNRFLRWRLARARAENNRLRAKLGLL